MIDLKKEIKNAKSIAISGHIRPDGDCIGSVSAMYQYLKKLMPDAKVDVYLEEPPHIFAFLKGVDQFDSTYKSDYAYDIFISLDSGDLERLGRAEKYFSTAKKTICVDHHISNNGFADINYVEADASSTCELIYDLIEPEEMDVYIAEAIFTGIVHDTGVFQYSCTSPKTFQILSVLAAYEFDRSAIIDATFYQKSYIQNQIMGRALLESILFMDGKCIVSMIDQKTMDFYSVTPKSLDGIVNQLRVTKGVECAIFMYQVGTMEYKVSLRSNRIVDVSKVAMRFNGGGHVRAAGCTMNGTFHDVVNNLSYFIEQQLEAAQHTETTIEQGSC
ncbi:MAG: bifunctional oligoribonuclease/PAP phosphatase NrnA [Clostridia bacterium]|nr:bifunctional oligoribonuclease/PAP phosphatase NrnA [Clostridia bacterium]